ncbi:MAG: KpsF/GutQ family sugar-phosphate isomerase, partial [Kiloniellales bacterium]|nr:KpsF/GutQ family sugar-phosphate isomerase [Kiloniellales bacterium]
MTTNKPLAVSLDAKPQPENQARPEVQSHSDQDVARRVLMTESQALQTLAGSLDRSFHKALNILAGVTGRVIVTGMGKSGHIARKIAAT